MKLRHLLSATLTLALLCFGLAAQAAEVEGVKFDDRTKLGNADLVLNGTGLRSRLFFKVYAIGLYLPEKKAAAADVLAQKGARRLRVVTLRELTAEQFADALVEGIQKNSTPAETEALKARVDKFRTTILELKTAPKGTTVLLDLLPESGTRLSFNGEKRGEDIPGDDFQRALLRIWLGDKPAQDDLKDALLGKAQ